MKRLLVLSTIPAPYRTAVFKGLAERFQTTVCLERCTDEERNADWFERSGENIRYSMLTDPDAAADFRETLRDIGQYDAVLCYEPWTKTARKTMNRCILNKTKFIINADGALKIRAKGLKAAVKRFYVERSALCLAGSQKAVEYFKCYGAEDKKIIRHPFTSLYESDILSEPVSRQEKEILREKYGLPNKVTLIAAGQFIVRKGFDLLLQAWDDAYDAQLYLVGGGGKRAEYEDYLRRHNITNVEIIDFLPREQLFDYYRMSDVFLMPTREDIWGLVVNEAMAKGLPVISSDRCTAGNELIRNGENGFIYPVEDTAKLRELMRKLIDQPELRLELSENALLAIRDHTYENVIRSHCDVIEQILDT